MKLFKSFIILFFILFSLFFVEIVSAGDIEYNPKVVIKQGIGASYIFPVNSLDKIEVYTDGIIINDWFGFSSGITDGVIQVNISTFTRNVIVWNASVTYVSAIQSYIVSGLNQYGIYSIYQDGIFVENKVSGNSASVSFLSDNNGNITSEFKLLMIGHTAQRYFPLLTILIAILMIGIGITFISYRSDEVYNVYGLVWRIVSFIVLSLLSTAAILLFFR